MFIGPLHCQLPLLPALFSVGALLISYYFVRALCILRIIYHYYVFQFYLVLNIFIFFKFSFREVLSVISVFLPCF